MLKHILLRAGHSRFGEALAHDATLAPMHFLVNAVVRIEHGRKIGVRSIALGLLEVLALAVHILSLVSAPLAILGKVCVMSTFQAGRGVDQEAIR